MPCDYGDEKMCVLLQLLQCLDSPGLAFLTLPSPRPEPSFRRGLGHATRVASAVWTTEACESCVWSSHAPYPLCVQAGEREPGCREKTQVYICRALPSAPPDHTTILLPFRCCFPFPYCVLCLPPVLDTDAWLHHRIICLQWLVIFTFLSVAAYWWADCSGVTMNSDVITTISEPWGLFLHISSFLSECRKLTSGTVLL